MQKTRNIIPLALLLAFAAAASAQEAGKTNATTDAALSKWLSVLDANDKADVSTVRFTVDSGSGGYFSLAKDGTITYAEGATPEQAVRMLIGALLSELQNEKEIAQGGEKHLNECLDGFKLALDAYTMLQSAITAHDKPAKEEKR